MRTLIGIFYIGCVFVVIGVWQIRSRVRDAELARTYARGVADDELVWTEGRIVSYITSSADSLPDSFLLEEKTGRLFQVSISTVSSRAVAAKITQNAYAYGDLLKVRGFVSPVNTDMRWINGAHLRISPREIEIIYVTDAWLDRMVQTLYAIRAYIVEQLISTFGSLRGGLLAGLIVEGGALLDSDTKKLFQKTGLSHIVALSGYNTSIIIDFSTLVLSAVLPRRLRIVMTGGLAILFCIMTGASPPLLRASIMALLRLLADITYRRFNALRALLFSGCCIAAYNPFLIFYSLSFQLSFLATLGLIVFARPLQMMCRKFLPNFIAQTLATTVAAQIYTLPLLVYRFHGLSIISFVANVVVLPVIPFLMLGAAIAVVVPYEIVIKVLSIIVDILLYVVTFMANIKHAYVYASLHQAWLITFWLFGLVAGWWFMRRQKRNETRPHSS